MFIVLHHNNDYSASTLSKTVICSSKCQLKLEPISLWRYYNYLYYINNDLLSNFLESSYWITFSKMQSIPVFLETKKANHLDVLMKRIFPMRKRWQSSLCWSNKDGTKLTYVYVMWSNLEPRLFNFSWYKDLDNKFDILEHKEHGIVTQLSQHSNVINKKIKSNAKCIS